MKWLLLGLATLPMGWVVGATFVTPGSQWWVVPIALVHGCIVGWMAGATDALSERKR